MPRVWRIVKTFPISAVSLPFSSSMMNRRPVPEVRASTFCVTPRPLRVSRTSLPMSCGVYFKSLAPFSTVTVREYYGFFVAKVNIMLPYGNIKYHRPSEKSRIFPYGNKPWSPLRAFLSNKKEAGGFELSFGHDPPRPDPKDYRRGRKRKHRTPYHGKRLQGHRHHACAKACDPEGPPLTSPLHTGAD